MTPENSRILQAILAIQAGDKAAREDFLAECKPFVAKTTMNICKRTLEWGECDELSIALIAFNSAIDSYDAGKKVPFLPYARVVVQNRLKDHFRKTARLRAEVPLEQETEDGKIFSPAEIQASWTDFRDRTIEDERQDEIAEFEEMLSTFGIDFAALVEVSPKHRDSRHTLVTVAGFVAGNTEVLKRLLDKKQLPINELVLQTGVNRKTLERGRKFIVATALVLCHKARFPYICSYIDLSVD